MNNAVRFDAAFSNALELLQKNLLLLAPAMERVLLVRDVLGCFRILVNDSSTEARPDNQADSFVAQANIENFAQDFLVGVGQYAPPANNLIQWLEADNPLGDLFDLPEAWTPPDSPSYLKVLDRLVTGREWLLPQLPNKLPRPPRAVFFGLKGGVGRSTALAVLAWHLSAQGKKVLVIDLDLESPGLGPILLPTSLPQEGDTCVPGWPTFGVVDWFVEDTVGQADESLIRDMYVRSPLASHGDILVVPACGGLLDQQYLSKLSRAYLDLPTRAGETELFGDRLARMLDQLESVVSPDVVLIDSRAGLHDISSVTLTRLGAHNFLFAVNTRQTWEGYRHLFRHWQRTPEHLRDLRKHLSVVGALCPAADESYLQELSESAADVFAEIYDADAGADDFNYAPGAEDAPHYPIAIHAHAEYAIFAPQEKAAQLNKNLIQFVFGDFLENATAILFPEVDET